MSTCPKCGYPECKDGKVFLGIFNEEYPCPHCHYISEHMKVPEKTTSYEEGNKLVNEILDAQKVTKARERDLAFAVEVVARLNALLDKESTRQDIAALIEQRVLVSKETREHPTLQCIDFPEGPLLGVLGLINGFIGVLPDQTGYIAADYDDNMNLVKFIVRMEK